MRTDGTRSTIGRRVAAVVAVSTALLAVGAVAAMQGVPEFGDFPLLDGDDQPAMPPPGPAASASPPPIEPSETNPVFAVIAVVLLSIAVLAVLYFVIRALVAWIRQAWRDRPLKRVAAIAPDVGGAAPAAEPEVHAPVVRSALAAALEAVEAHAAPADAIVAAWVGLEQSADDAGLHRGRAETPGEFTVRIVGSRPAAESDIRALLRLYENVRFGGAAADEADRDRARRLLQAIEGEWR